MKKFGVIMAGGGGTRFWPLSREKMPKQLLNLSGRDCMLNEAIDRLAQVTEREYIFVVTNGNQADGVRALTAGKIPAENILSEPAARNTAACIGYAACYLRRKFGDGVMIVTPSDAYIRDEGEFARVLNVAAGDAAKGERLVTVGITPTFPATGYGYIKATKGESEVKEVERFVEKPSLSVAQQYLAEGGYYWNSGMFLWTVSLILQKMEQFLPDVYAGLCEIERSDWQKLDEIYPTLRSVSVDYGIMEKTDGVVTVPGEFGWNDVGSFDQLGALHPADDDGNVTVGDVLAIGSRDNVLYSSGRLVATVGVDGLAVIETADAVLVCPKERAQEVKKIVESLKERGRKELL